MKNDSGIVWKVVLGFAIVAALMASTYWITYHNLESLKKKISALSEPNPKYVFRKKIITEVNDIDSYINMFTIRNDFSLLETYDSTVTLLGQNMDSLSQIAADNPAYLAKLHSLGNFITEKLNVSEDRIQLTNNSD